MTTPLAVTVILHYCNVVCLSHIFNDRHFLLFDQVPFQRPDHKISVKVSWKHYLTLSEKYLYMMNLNQPNDYVVVNTLTLEYDSNLILELFIDRKQSCTVHICLLFELDSMTSILHYILELPYVQDMSFVSILEMELMSREGSWLLYRSCPVSIILD